MNTHPMVVQQEYNVPVAKLWQAITDADEMRNCIFACGNLRRRLVLSFNLLQEQKKACNTFIFVKYQKLYPKINLHVAGVTIEQNNCSQSILAGLRFLKLYNMVV